MKRSNSVIALITICTLIGHIFTTMLFLLTGFRIELLNNIFARTTYGLLLLHILISIIVLLRHDAKPVSVKYPLVTKRVWIQRATGVAILILLHPHISQMVLILRQLPMEGAGKLKFILINLLFFGTIFLHIAISFSRAFISLGLMVEINSIKKCDRITYTLCLLGFLLTAICLLFFIKGY